MKKSFYVLLLLIGVHTARNNRKSRYWTEVYSLVNWKLPGTIESGWEMDFLQKNMKGIMNIWVKKN